MDLVTHVLLGACVAQLPGQGRCKPLKTPLPGDRSAAQQLSFWQRAGLGGMAAIFPDIDYLLFLYSPLDFLAYWHRGETHSLLLAPLWAALLTYICLRSFKWRQQQTTLYWICLLGVISHSLSDSLTSYGTQWFAPFSHYRVSWNLLFVVDIYFTATVGMCFFCLWRKQATNMKFYVFAAPLVYLVLVALFKHLSMSTITSGHTQPLLNRPITLTPQPLSPLHWQALQRDDNSVYQAYLSLANDPVARQISVLLDKEVYADSFHQPGEVTWRRYELVPTQAAARAWQQSAFQAFKDFALFPVLYQHHKTPSQECFWFSDLRYHWPGFLPAFRYGMCTDNKQTWQPYRMGYFSVLPLKLAG